MAIMDLISSLDIRIHVAEMPQRDDVLHVVVYARNWTTLWDTVVSSSSRLDLEDILIERVSAWLGGESLEEAAHVRSVLGHRQFKRLIEEVSSRGIYNPLYFG